MSLSTLIRDQTGNDAWVAELDRETALSQLHALVEAEQIDTARALAPRLLRKWPADPVLQHWSRVLAPPRVVSVTRRMKASREKEYAWLREHRHEHPGCWIALYEDRLIIAHPDLGEVYQVVEDTVPDGDALLFFQEAGSG
jgi:hypothetical protein